MNYTELRYQLYNIGTTVYFRILEQPEWMRWIKDFKAKNGMWFRSNPNHPEIYSSTVYLRGDDRTNDDRRDGLAFSSLPAALRYMADVHEALTELSDSLAPPESAATDGHEIFTVEFKKKG